MKEADLRRVHRLAGALYHILLGIAVVGVAASGFVIFLRVRARLRR